jgi:hypothetical protein
MNQIRTQTADETQLAAISAMCESSNISLEALPEVLRYWKASVELCKFSTKLGMIERMIERHLPEIQSIKIAFDGACEIQFRSKRDSKE